MLAMLVFSTGSLKASTLINLDGTFDDWDNSPSLSDDQEGYGSDDLKEVRWHLDQSNHTLYLYIERYVADNKQWYVWLEIIGENGPQNAAIIYNAKSLKVDIIIYDRSGKRLYAQKGDWGASDGLRFEVGIPIHTVVESPQAGYEIDFRVYSTLDSVPDRGYIKISAISTFPYIASAFLALIVGSYVFHKRKRV